MSVYGSPEQVEQFLADLEHSSPEDMPEVLRGILARVWVQGWTCAFEDGGEAWNPYVPGGGL